MLSHGIPVSLRGVRAAGAPSDGPDLPRRRRLRPPAPPARRPHPLTFSANLVWCSAGGDSANRRVLRAGTGEPGVAEPDVGQNERVPELPEVQALVDFLARADRRPGRRGGRARRRSACSRPTTRRRRRSPALPVDRVARHGKFVDLDGDGMHLVFHLARAGWLRWSRRAAPRRRCARASRPIALRVPALRRLAASTSPRPAPEAARGVHRARPAGGARHRDARARPARPTASTGATLAAMLGGRRTQVKGAAARPGLPRRRRQRLLRRDPARRQALAVRRWPRAWTRSRSTGCTPRCATIARSTRSTAASGKPAKELKDAKRAGMRVHGRTGLPCPVCGDTVREVSFADSLAAVLPDLPDRRQAARRPADVPAAEVAAAGALCQRRRWEDAGHGLDPHGLRPGRARPRRWSSTSASGRVVRRPRPRRGPHADGRAALAAGRPARGDGASLAVVCRSGSRSARVVAWLTQQGYDVVQRRRRDAGLGRRGQADGQRARHGTHHPLTVCVPFVGPTILEAQRAHDDKRALFRPL